jgi:hypothetical protein
VLKTSITYLKSRSGEEVRSLVTAAPELAGETGDYKAFRERHHGKFRQRIACDSRETVPASLAIVRLAGLAASLGANFGRDADKIACMAAGICGALRGMSAKNAAPAPPWAKSRSPRRFPPPSDRCDRRRRCGGGAHPPVFG